MKPSRKKEKKQNPLSRREALSRMGLSAFSAASMMMLLNKPAKADDDLSPELPPPWDW